MSMLVLSANDFHAALSMREAIETVKQAYANIARGFVSAPPRTGIDVRDPSSSDTSVGTTLLMGASIPGIGLSTKIVSVFPNNPSRGVATVQGSVLVLDPETGQARALIDGTALTAWRTGAASGASTDLLARRDARHGCVFGCGVQARTQVLAIDCVREFDTISIFARDPRRVERFIEELQPQVRAKLQSAISARAAVAEADVVCAATTSRTPVFDGADLQPGTHVSGVGSFTLDMREIDATTVDRSTIFVDSLESALDEAGDLVRAEAEGVTHRDDWIELGRVVTGEHFGRSNTSEITFFKSVGHAAQDVCAAALALENAHARGLGTRIDDGNPS